MKELTKEIAMSLNGKRIRLTAKQNIDWYTAKIDEAFHVFVDNESNIWFFERKNSRKGLLFSSIRDAEYKIL